VSFIQAHGLPGKRKARRHRRAQGKAKDAVLRSGAFDGGAGLAEGSGEAVEEQEGEKRGVEEGEAVVRFDEPVIVDDTTESSKIDETVEGLPVPAAKTADPAFSGRDGQGDQQQKTSETDSDKRSLADIFEHASEVKRLIRADIGEEVEAHAEKGKQAQHAAQANKIREVKELPDRSDGEGDQKKAKSPIAGEMLKESDGLGANVGGQRKSSQQSHHSPGDVAEGNQAEKKYDDFRPRALQELAQGITHVSNIS